MYGLCGLKIKVKCLNLSPFNPPASHSLCHTHTHQLCHSRVRSSFESVKRGFDMIVPQRMKGLHVLHQVADEHRTPFCT